MRSNKPLQKFNNRKIIITAGGTIEPIDSVRYIGNHSSGKMGMALIKALSQYSRNITLIYAAIQTPLPKNIRAIPVKTVDDMYREIKKNLTKDSILIMSAAVSDFKVKKIHGNKIKKAGKLTLELIPTIDILKELSKIKRKDNIFAGFALDTDNIIKNGQKKLVEKKLDLVVANPLTKKNYPFGSDHNQAFLIDKTNCIRLPRMKKTELAKEIVKYMINNI